MATPEGSNSPQIREHPGEGHGRGMGPPAFVSDLRTGKVVGQGTVPLSLGEKRRGEGSSSV